jgi:hypothetical protein
LGFGGWVSAEGPNTFLSLNLFGPVPIFFVAVTVVVPAIGATVGVMVMFMFLSTTNRATNVRRPSPIRRIIDFIASRFS